MTIEGIVTTAIVFAAGVATGVVLNEHKVLTTEDLRRGMKNVKDMTKRSMPSTSKQPTTPAYTG